MLPPLIERELRAALRNGAVRTRLWIIVSGVALAVLHLVFARGIGAASHSQSLFHLLLLASSGSAMLQTYQVSIDLVVRERRQQTLGLLILTGLSTSEVFFSKLTGALVVQLCNGLALLPCFALSFVMGGVPGSAFLATAAIVPNLMVLTLAISLAASTIAREEDGAMFAAGLIAAFVSLVGPAVYFGLTRLSPAPPSQFWLLTSPPYGLIMIWDFFRSSAPARFWINSSVTLCWSLSLISAAAWFLRRTWRDEGRSGTFLWRPSFVDRQVAKNRAAALAGEKQRLMPNPIVWLALRDKRSIRLAWASVSLITIAWISVRLLWPNAWGTLMGSIIAVCALYTVAGLMALYSAAKRIGEDRRSGALELLLTTTLSIEEIVLGQRQALRLGFRSLLQCLLGLSAAIGLSAILARPWDVLAVALCLESWALVACTVVISLRSYTLSQVIWAALNSGRPLLAIQKVVCPPGTALFWVYGIYSLSTSSWMQRFPEGSTGEFTVVTAILFGACILTAFSAYNSDVFLKRLKREFRWVAQQPVPEPSDPRLRRWDPSKPFPQPSGLRWFGR